LTEAGAKAAEALITRLHDLVVRRGRLPCAGRREP
jgi:hypothetical protein